MKTRRKKWLGAAFGLLAVAGLTQGAHATGPNGAQQDSLTVTITPTASYAVKITTFSSGPDLGSVGLGLSTQTVTPSTVTITSSYATTGLTLRGQIQGAHPWSFAANTSAQIGDELAAWAVFTDTSVTGIATLGVPGGNYFRGNLANTSNSNVVDAGGARQVGTGAGNVQFIAASGVAGYKTMAALPPTSIDTAASKSHLWLYFVLPPATSDVTLATQYVTFTLSAGPPN